MTWRHCGMDNGQKTNLHGFGVNVFGVGVLILGKSGIGKSELGLGLIDRGHKFVVDDFVVIEKDSDETLWMSALDFAEPFIHIRGIGFIDISRIYSNISNIMSSSKLDLVIELSEDNELLNKDVITQSQIQHLILNTTIEKRMLPIGNNRNLCLLVEILVKSYIQLKNGYDSTQYFLDNHSNLLNMDR